MRGRRISGRSGRGPVLVCAVAGALAAAVFFPAGAGTNPNALRDVHPGPGAGSVVTQSR